MNNDGASEIKIPIDWNARFSFQAGLEMFLLIGDARLYEDPAYRPLVDALWDDEQYLRILWSAKDRWVALLADEAIRLMVDCRDFGLGIDGLREALEEQLWAPALSLAKERLGRSQWSDSDDVAGVVRILRVEGAAITDAVDCAVTLVAPD